MAHMRRCPDGLFDRLADGRTVSGREIYIYDTSRENHFRNKIILLSLYVRRVVESLGIPEHALAEAVDCLRTAYLDPRHYGDNRPGGRFDRSLSETEAESVPDARFSYLDLISYGFSAEGGFKEFAEVARLPVTVDMRATYVLIALLLIDSAVASLDAGDAMLAASDICEAFDIFGEMVTQQRHDEGQEAGRKALASRAGKAAHWESREFESQVLAEWDTGRFNGNKTEAARWATSQFPITLEVVRRWIRAHEGRKAATRLAE